MYGIHTVKFKAPIDLIQCAEMLHTNTASIYQRIRKLKNGKSFVFHMAPFSKRGRFIRNESIIVTRVLGSFSVSLVIQVAPLDVFTLRTFNEGVFELDGATGYLDRMIFKSMMNDVLKAEFGKFGAFIPLNVDNWQVNYIEYAANIHTENVELTLEMLRKNAKDVKTRTFRDDDGDVLTLDKLSKHKTNGSMSLYDKRKAMKAKHNYDDESLDGIIRYERKLGRNYIFGSIANSNPENDCIDFYFRDSVAKSVLASSYRQNFCIGEFVTLDAMRLMLDNKKLIEYAEIVAKSRSIKREKVKCKHGSKISTATNNARIRAFDSAFISPVPIPVRANTAYLSNPYREFESNTENYNAFVERLKINLLSHIA